MSLLRSLQRPFLVFGLFWWLFSSFPYDLLLFIVSFLFYSRQIALLPVLILPQFLKGPIRSTAGLVHGFSFSLISCSPNEVLTKEVHLKLLEQAGASSDASSLLLYFYAYLKTHDTTPSDKEYVFFFLSILLVSLQRWRIPISTRLFAPSISSKRKRIYPSFGRAIWSWWFFLLFFLPWRIIISLTSSLTSNCLYLFVSPILLMNPSFLRTFPSQRINPLMKKQPWSTSMRWTITGSYSVCSVSCCISPSSFLSCRLKEHVQQIDSRVISSLQFFLQDLKSVHLEDFLSAHLQKLRPLLGESPMTSSFVQIHHHQDSLLYAFFPLFLTLGISLNPFISFIPLRTLIMTISSMTSISINIHASSSSLWTTSPSSLLFLCPITRRMLVFISFLSLLL